MRNLKLKLLRLFPSGTWIKLILDIWSKTFSVEANPPEVLQENCLALITSKILFFSKLPSISTIAISGNILCRDDLNI